MFVGGKAKNLIKLKELKYPVPPFIVLTPKEITSDNYHTKLESFTKGKAKFAVRSSGSQEDSKTKSFAGIFKTETNLSANNLPKAIKKVTSTKLNTFLYDEAPQQVAVIVQEYVEATYSGVCLTNLDGYLIINIHKGVGEELVSGRKKGEEIRINRKSFFYIQKPKILLNYSKFIRTFLMIERDFQSPQDIEFCIDKNDKFWILQTRPITT